MTRRRARPPTPPPQPRATAAAGEPVPVWHRAAASRRRWRASGVSDPSPGSAATEAAPLPESETPLARHHRRQNVRRGLARERPLSGKHFVKNTAEGPDVGALV